MPKKTSDKIWWALSYVLVLLLGASLAVAGISLYLHSNGVPVEAGTSKLNQLIGYFDAYYIEDVDVEALEDAAAEAIVEAVGDRWSYYVPESQYASYLEQQDNAYVGIGITIRSSEETASQGIEIMAVTEGGPAEAAGILPHDILVAVEGQRCTDLGISGTKDLVRGDPGTDVQLTVSRGGQELEFTVERKRFETPVAAYEMLPSGYGLITIENFESKCASETINAMEALVAQGAKGLIFDVRFNPGGKKDELVKVLDYLLPEGPLFRSVNYKGEEQVDYSDEKYLDLPMAVLVNGDSYSAAEFFAAALQEYHAAVAVGQQTCGKGNYQNHFPLVDGSLVSISTGRYFTPNGESLTDVGVTPDVPVEVDADIYDAIYWGELSHQEDPQLEAAISTLNSAQ